MGGACNRPTMRNAANVLIGKSQGKRPHQKNYVKRPVGEYY